ncbi:hypothetical protein NE577_15665, partial [Cloacibacillus evryensis]|nr:hypothetical protein [Cloacibacillus evryensis]
GVLAAMRRGYGAADFAKTAPRARDVLGDGLHISTDLMVGFPSEDGEAFRHSLDFVREQGFGKVHVFPYSPREGTTAAAMKRVGEAEMRPRVNEALSLAAELHQKFCSNWIGRECGILTEESDGTAVKGLTRNYIRITAASAAGINEEGRGGFLIWTGRSNSAPTCGGRECAGSGCGTRAWKTRTG